MIYNFDVPPNFGIQWVKIKAVSFVNTTLRI
jgi:hypothetical protein